MALPVFKQAFGSARKGRSTLNGGKNTQMFILEVTDAVQSVVDTLRGPNGERYSVSLSASATQNAANPGAKSIVVSHVPVFDSTLKLSTACTVMTGLVFHEVGHTLYTFPDLETMDARWGGREKNRLAYTVVNIADDARLEHRMAARFPICRDVFPTTLHWLAIRAGMLNEHVRWAGKTDPLAERVNFAVRSFRYPWTAVWSKEPATRAERLWWQDWAREYIALPDGDITARLDAIDVACDRLRNPNEVEDPAPPPDEPGDEPGDEPSDEPGDETEPGQPGGFGDDFDEPESDKDEDDEDGQPGGAGVEDDEDDEDEDDDVRDPWDEDTDDDDDSDEDSDSDDDSDDDSDEDGEPNPGGGNPADDDTDTDEDTDSGDPDGEPTDEGESDEEDISEFDSTHIKGNTLDDLNNQWSRNGRMLQTMLDRERTMERVNSGRWGTARVEVRTLVS